MRSLFTAFLLMGMAQIAVAEDDVIKLNLEKSKAEYGATLDKAKADFVAAFDTTLQEISKKGNLEYVKTVAAEKKAFESDGKIPSSASMRFATSEYEAANRKARDAVISAYDKAIAAYTKALQIDKADAVKSEFEAFKKEIGPKTSQSIVKKPSYEYKFYTWKEGDSPVKMIHKEEGFCYLTLINGALNGGGELAQVEIRDDGFWYLSGKSSANYLRLQAIAVKINND